MYLNSYLSSIIKLRYYNHFMSKVIFFLLNCSCDHKLHNFMLFTERSSWLCFNSFLLYSYYFDPDWKHVKKIILPLVSFKSKFLIWWFLGLPNPDHRQGIASKIAFGFFYVVNVSQFYMLCTANLLRFPAEKALPPSVDTGPVRLGGAARGKRRSARHGAESERVPSAFAW